MLFSLLLPIVIGVVGMILLIRLRFFFVLHPKRTFYGALSSIKNRDTRRSFFLALAGTLGVGNIFGVSAGLMIGGAGCLFWLFVSSLFSMVIKYAETLLVFNSSDGIRGMASVIKSSFGRLGGALSSIYAAFTVALSLFMGSAMQTVALVDVADSALNLNPVFPILIVVALFIPCLVGGARKIESATEIIIPLTTIIYIMMCIFTIVMNYRNIISTILLIFSSAFSSRGVLGGISAVAIKEGFCRGILSNEAGVGTSALAHVRSRGRSPHVGGVFGIIEVFFDTTLLCMLTGFAILVSGVDISQHKTPMSLVNSAFSSSIGSFSGYVLLFCIFCFAYSTIICWYFYGLECSRSYFTKIKTIYSIFFLIFIFLSIFLSSTLLLFLTDSILFMMAILTLSAIMKNINTVIIGCREGIKGGNSKYLK